MTSFDTTQCEEQIRDYEPTFEDLAEYFEWLDETTKEIEE